MTIPAIQLATICRDIDAKAVGMNEIINGGTTSVGAQLRNNCASTKSQPIQLTYALHRVLLRRGLSLSQFTHPWPRVTFLLWHLC